MPSHKTTPDTVALPSPQLLAQARSGTGRKWAAHALCVGADPEMFFPPGDGPAIEARRICAMCPVRGQCLAYAVTADEPFGIWGGLDPQERENLHRQLRRREPSGNSRAGSAVCRRNSAACGPGSPRMPGGRVPWPAPTRPRQHVRPSSAAWSGKSIPAACSRPRNAPPSYDPLAAGSARN